MDTRQFQEFLDEQRREFVEIFDCRMLRVVEALRNDNNNDLPEEEPHAAPVIPNRTMIKRLNTLGDMEIVVANTARWFPMHRLANNLGTRDLQNELMANHNTRAYVEEVTRHPNAREMQDTFEQNEEILGPTV